MNSRALSVLLASAFLTSLVALPVNAQVDSPPVQGETFGEFAGAETLTPRFLSDEPGELPTTLESMHSAENEAAFAELASAHTTQLLKVVEPLDLENVALQQPPSASVGGGEVVEGFVTKYGAFRLGGGLWECMIMVEGRFPNPNFFNQVELEYVREYVAHTCCRCGHCRKGRKSGKRCRCCIEGSLYKATMDDDSVRYFLFENKNVGCFCGLYRRHVIVYDLDGKVLDVQLAKYQTGLQKP